MTVEQIELGGRTFHLRATMGALRDAKTEHGIDITNLGDDPLDMVVLAYHFAKAGALAQGSELKLTLSEFEQSIEAADLPVIGAAFEAVMNTGGGKKK